MRSMAITGISSSAIRTLRGRPGERITTDGRGLDVLDDDHFVHLLVSRTIVRQERTSVRIDATTVIEQMFDVNARPASRRAVTALLSRLAVCHPDLDRPGAPRARSAGRARTVPRRCRRAAGHG